MSNLGACRRPQDKSEMVSLVEYVCGMATLTRGTLREKAQLAFDVSLPLPALPPSPGTYKTK